ncbi:DUF1102 domain-containing protein [Natronomonas gomsonensis]|uniref:DUF1102 domain-containing protein n=1 Tax=Natronomonas gomsonensis TaxID=1046043 RepID=UPI0015C0D244|nr:DUF1102 domain-containing protein [Natronomonas gomsonensis]
MKRRSILMGMGGIAAGSSALVGSGAFTSVSANRNVAVAVVDDPNALLGLGGCEGSPNGQYARIQDNGAMAIDLSESNNQIDGEGVNPDALTKIRDVFQIKNQGTQETAVWIDVDPVEDRVEFYLHEQELDENENAKIIGYDNRVCLDVGDSVCVSMDIDTRGLGSDFTNEDGVNNLMKKLGDSDHEMVINAMAGECPVEGSEGSSEPTSDTLWGITRGNGAGELKSFTVPNPSVDSEIIDFDDSGRQNFPNGLAYDPENERWYYGDTTDAGDGVLHLYDGSVTELQQITDGEDLAGATWDDGNYYFIPQGTSKLKRAEIDESDGSVKSVDDVVDVGSNMTLGDLAIAHENSVLYGSSSSEFFKVELSENTDDVSSSDVETIITSGEAVGKQIAFGVGDDGKVLYGHDANSGAWFEIELDGGASQLDESTETFTDIA